MLVGSYLLIIAILSFSSPLIPAAPNRSHNAVKLNIFQTGCGHPKDRQEISIGTFYPIRYLPGSKHSLPCTPLTPAGVSCNMTRLHSDPLVIAVDLKAKSCTDNGYIEVKMHVDSIFTLVAGTLSPKKSTQVLPPSTGNAAHFASAILPSATLANCAKGFIFGTAKILHRKTPIPTDCIDAHTGVQRFADHVVIGVGCCDYMTAKEIQQLPAPESRALVAAARNNVVFTNDMYTALSQAYTEAQLLVNDMKNNLLPAPRPKSISVNIGDALIIIGVFLPLIPFGSWSTLVGAVGASILITGTIMNEQPESPETVFDIVSDNRLQKMQDATQTSFLNIMNTTFFTDQNYTAFNQFYNESVQDFSYMKEQIKQQAVGWSASKILNFYGLKICDNPDDFDDPWNQWPIVEGLLCNDKIANTTADCRLGGGYENDGGGYFYAIPNGNCVNKILNPDDKLSSPLGNILNFAVYLPNGSYNDLCNSQNGWNITREKCHWYDFPPVHERATIFNI